MDIRSSAESAPGGVPDSDGARRMRARIAAQWPPRLERRRLLSEQSIADGAGCRCELDVAAALAALAGAPTALPPRRACTVDDCGREVRPRGAAAAAFAGRALCRRKQGGGVCDVPAGAPARARTAGANALAFLCLCASRERIRAPPEALARALRLGSTQRP